MPEFEWWEPKRLFVLRDRGLDFRDAEALLGQSLLFTYASPRGAEERWVSVGFLEGERVAVIWTRRGENIRIISMRRTRREGGRRFGSLYG
jgi:uncharacterized DUF497 family protein